jgi:hypothetical protein
MAREGLKVAPERAAVPQTSGQTTETSTSAKPFPILCTVGPLLDLMRHITSGQPVGVTELLNVQDKHAIATLLNLHLAEKESSKTVRLTPLGDQLRNSLGTPDEGEALTSVLTQEGEFHRFWVGLMARRESVTATELKAELESAFELSSSTARLYAANTLSFVRRAGMLRPGERAHTYKINPHLTAPRPRPARPSEGHTSSEGTAGTSSKASITSNSLEVGLLRVCAKLGMLVSSDTRFENAGERSEVVRMLAALPRPSGPPTKGELLHRAREHARAALSKGDREAATLALEYLEIVSRLLQEVPQ